MKITFYGAAGCVTGSCFLLETATARVLVDCGLFQGSQALKERNYGPFPFAPEKLDAVLLTHAHIDHTGLVPKLYKHGCRAPAYATSATVDLLSALLPDSAHIQEMEVERKNRKNARSGKPLLEPIYSVEDARRCQEFMRGVEYGQEVQVAAGVRARFLDAGHILGSAMIEVFTEEAGETRKLLFTGDIGKYGQPIINDPTQVQEADYVVMESTYGARLHQEPEDKLEALAAIIKETFARGGNLIIPAFAVERTQDLLYDLNLLIHRGDLKAEHIYVDSPLAAAATDIFCRYPQYYDQETQALRLAGGGQCPLYLPGLKISRTVEDSLALNKVKSGAIIIAASGMADAGRVKHHLKHNLWRPECTVLFVGYQAEGTLGRRLLDGEKKVHIHGEEVMVRARVCSLEGFSAHADQEELLRWLRGFTRPPRTVFVVHGEEAGAQTLRRIIEQELGWRAIVPAYREEVELQADRVLEHVPEAEAQAPVSGGAVEDLYRQVLRKLDRLLEGPDKARVARRLALLGELLEQLG